MLILKILPYYFICEAAGCGIERYEIFHDMLAQSILDWRKQYLQAKENKEQLKRWINWSLGVVAVVFAGWFLLWNSLRVKTVMWKEKEISYQLDTSSKLQALEKLMTLQQDWDNRAFIKDLPSFLEPIKDLSYINDPPNIPELNGTLQEILASIQERNKFNAQNEVWSVSFSPYSQMLAAASIDGKISLWDLQGNSIVDPFQAHDEPVWSVSFSPDGKTLASASKDGTVRLWHLDKNQIDKHPIVLKGHTEAVWNVSFSPDGQKLASASADQTVRLWDLQGKPIGEPFEGHTNRIRSVSFSPDGKQLASASEDGTVRLWDLQGKPIGEPFEGHEGIVYSVNFSSDGEILASASEDGTVRLWNLQGIELEVLKDHKTPIWSVSFSPDGQLLATALQDGTIRLWSLKDQKWIESVILKGHTGPIYDFSFISSDSDDSDESKKLHLISGSADKTVRLWDLKSEPLLPQFATKDKIWSISFIPPESKQLVIGSNNGTIHLWSLKDKIDKTLDKSSNGAVISLSSSPDGQHLASGYTDGTVHLWKLHGDKLDDPKSISAHEDWVWGVDFSPNNGQRSNNGQQLLATSSSDGYVRLWDLEGESLGEFLNEVQSKDQSTIYPVWSVRFNPSNREELAIASADGNVHLCKLQENKLYKQDCKTIPKAHEGSVWSVSFSPDGHYLASASADGTFSLWDLQNNSLKKFPVKDRDEDEKVEVYSITFSQDGTKLATGSRDGTVRLWDIQGNRLAKFQNQGEVRGLSFSSDSKYLAIGSEDGTVKLRLTEDFDQLLVRSCDLLEDYLANPSRQKTQLTICQDN